MKRLTNLNESKLCRKFLYLIKLYYPFHRQTSNLTLFVQIDGTYPPTPTTDYYLFKLKTGNNVYGIEKRLPFGRIDLVSGKV